MEEWKDIEGFEGLYKISSLGRIYSVRKKCCKKLQTSRQGYKICVLYDNHIHKNIRVHRIVAEAFIPNPNNLPCINHKDQNPSNNCVDNLERCDHKYNNNYGEHKKKLSLSHINNPKQCKPVNQYTLEGEFVSWFPSSMEAQRQFGYNSGHILSCCKGKRKTANGFIWRYASDVA